MNGTVSQKSLTAPIRSGFRRFSLPLVILLLPALMFHFMLPFTDTSISPSRDFDRYYIWQQMETLISVKFGSFPIYIPAVSGGNFCSLVAGYGQLYLPLPYLACLLPGYWTGYALDWLLLLNLLTISAAHLALFVFLKRLDLNQLLALALSTITVYTPRILVSFGYGAGIAAWTGHLFLCTAIGFYFFKPTRVKGPLLIIGSAYWLINSGHPAEVYFCMLGAWAFAFILPYLVEGISAHNHRLFKKRSRFWLFCGGYCLLAFLLSSAYIVPLYFDVVRNMDYADMSYTQAVTNTDTLPGLICNFLLPIKSGAFGNFAGTSMYLLVILIPLLKVFRISVDRAAWVILIAIGIIFLYMAGESTPMFSSLWQSLPFASNTRNPARASLMLPIIFLLALVWLFKKQPTVSFTLPCCQWLAPARTLLAAIGGLVLVAGLIAIETISPRLSVYVQLNDLFIPGWVKPLVMATSGITLLTVFAHGLTSRHKTAVEVLLCGIICIHLVLLMKYGSTPFAQKHENDVLTLEKLVAQKQRTLSIAPEYLFLFEAFAHKAELAQFQNYFIDPHLGQIFRKHLAVKNRQDAYRILNQCRQRDEVVLEGYQSDKNQFAMPADCEGKADRVRLQYSAYNRLVFEAEACQSGFFVLSCPDVDKHWRAWVNGEKVSIYSANGISQAVQIPAGASEIEFRYWSCAAFWGTLISCLTLALIGIAVGLRCPVRSVGYIITAVAIGMSAGLFFVWYNSLYAGKSFNTTYAWESPSAKQLSNLAYGKACEISARNKTHSAYLHPRRGVDGDRSFYSCFVTACHQNPWFGIDLKKPSMVESIVITTSLQGYEEDKMILYFNENVAATGIDGIFAFMKIPVLFNNLPLTIAVSSDNENWEFAKVDHMSPNIPQTIQLEEPINIRYIKIIATGTCRLCLNEVEVYPPEKKVPSRPNSGEE